MGASGYRGFSATKGLPAGAIRVVPSLPWLLGASRERPHLGDCGDGAQTRRRLPNNPGILAQRPESREPLRGLGPHWETPPAPAQGPIVHQRIASYPLISNSGSLPESRIQGSVPRVAKAAPTFS